MLNKYDSSEHLNKLFGELGELYKESKNDYVKTTIKQVFTEKENNSLSRPALLETLANIYFYDADYQNVVGLNKSLVTEFPGTIYEKNGRLNLFSTYYIQGNLESAGNELSSIPKEYSDNDEVKFAKWLLSKSLDSESYPDPKFNAKIESVPDKYELSQNYPNPFNPATTITYQIPEDGLVTLKIYDILGREVKTLVNEQKTTGMYEISFDASNLVSGVYIYKLQVNDLISSKKMMLLK
jgi:hypothetical protein